MHKNDFGTEFAQTPL